MKTILQGTLLSTLAAAAAAQVPAGPEFRVNSSTTANQFMAEAAMEPDGDFVVVWASQDGSDSGIFGQRFGSAGARRGGEFLVNGSTFGEQSRPAVTVGRKGEFVVTWQDRAATPDDLVMAQRYAPDGVGNGGQTLLAVFAAGVQEGPRMGRAADGRLVVTWTTGDGLDGDRWGIAARRFDRSLNPLGNEFVVNTYSTGDQDRVALAVDASGRFVIVWQDNAIGRDGDGTAIFGQRYDASGTPLGGEFLVNASTTGHQHSPAVSVSPAGDVVVCWTTLLSTPTDREVFARRFDASGTPVGGDFRVNSYTTGSQVDSSIAHDARGNFVVAWQSDGQDGSGYGVFGQRFAADAARRGAEFRANTFTTDSQWQPVIAADEVGNFVVTWWSQGQDGSDLGVYAQRFGGLVPAALRVDTTGNGVLEPGEAVDVRPSWRNVNGAAQAFGGGLASPGGPFGSVPTIADATGDYATAPHAAVAECADCYVVAVPANPPPQPRHRDATVVETLTPGVHGQAKQWRLHVGDSFTDVPRASPFYRFVETLLHHDVTGGCNALEYCPSYPTSREQMAVFVLVAKEGAGYFPPECGPTPMFADVPATNPFCRWVEELARRGVIAGCGGGNYCPTGNVSREQMAVFVLRTLDPVLNPPACGAPVFADVLPTSPFCRWIEELVRRGVVTGCGGGNYCPTGNVTREQMAVFVAETFDLALYGP